MTSTDLVNQLISNGIVCLSAHDMETIRDDFQQLISILDQIPFDAIPQAIGGNMIRGSFHATEVAHRKGIYYGPEVDQYITDCTVRNTLRDIHQRWIVIADRWFNAICHYYSLDYTTLRKQPCPDTLLIAIYQRDEKDELNKTGLLMDQHTDFGLLTLGMSNQSGLQLLDNLSDQSSGERKWHDLSGHTPYIHTAKWLQKLIPNSHSAIHRVVNSQESSRRIFIGLFYEPNLTSIIDGETYLESINNSFINYYKGEFDSIPSQ